MSELPTQLLLIRPNRPRSQNNPAFQPALLGQVHTVHPVLLVHLVHPVLLVYLVHPVHLVNPVHYGHPVYPVNSVHCK